MRAGELSESGGQTTAGRNLGFHPAEVLPSAAGVPVRAPTLFRNGRRSIVPVRMAGRSGTCGRRCAAGARLGPVRRCMAAVRVVRTMPHLLPGRILLLVEQALHPFVVGAALLGHAFLLLGQPELLLAQSTRLLFVEREDAGQVLRACLGNLFRRGARTFGWYFTILGGRFRGCQYAECGADCKQISLHHDVVFLSCAGFRTAPERFGSRCKDSASCRNDDRCDGPNVRIVGRNGYSAG